jgi:hypothetical protein
MLLILHWVRLFTRILTQLVNSASSPRLEGLPVAQRVRQNLDAEDMPVYLWDRGTIAVSDYAVSSLEDEIE